MALAGSATAGDWQALNGAAAAPLTAAQMQAVQGKSDLDTFFDGLPGGYNTVDVGNGAQVRFWASDAGTQVMVSGAVDNGSATFGFSQTLTYNP
jgi:hypothetical protein